MSGEMDKKTDNSMRLEIGKRIEHLRTYRKMSREYVANKAGISAKFLYEVEKGKKGISAEILLRIGQILSSSCDYILTGENSRNSVNTIEVLGKFAPDQRKKIEKIIEIIYEIGNDR